jgi:hypothetical protein
LDYGAAWDDAWKSHVAAWRPPPNADAYVYPADVDETLPLRTVLEQEADPYPANLMTMCVTPDWSHRENGRTIQWYEVRISLISVTRGLYLVDSLMPVVATGAVPA